MEKAVALKEQGNKALADNNFDEAIRLYTEAISYDDKNKILYSNRSAAYAKAGKFEQALSDAEKTIELDTQWAKGYSRKGVALAGLQKYPEAFEAYAKGLEYDPTNQSLQDGRDEIKKLFISQFLNQQTPMDVDPQSPPPKRDPSPPKPADKKTPEEENLPENKKLARQEKELGNLAYKKKDFEKAIEHYNKAAEHDPTDITYQSNLAAVYFEQKDYEKCISQCERSIEIGRENRADFKLIAKAFTRIGNAYKKLENWRMAKVYYEKAMSEHRTPEVKTLLSDMERKIKEDERKAYIDPKKAEEEKEKGNELFKKGDYSNAIKHYTEAINRNPDDPRLYSNRAACYTKLAAFDLGLKDCDMCVKLDEKFIKGYIRKGKILQGMQQPSKAAAAYQKALDIDPSNAEALDGYRACTMACHNNPQEVWKNAMSDPEIQQILKDPAMRVILEQMQTDPNAVKDHLKNPNIADKVCKLIESGIVQIH